MKTIKALTVSIVLSIAVAPGMALACGCICSPFCSVCGINPM